MRPHHIVVIDDEFMIRKLIATIMRESGHYVTTLDGCSVRKTLDGDVYADADLLLMDLLMPVSPTMVVDCALEANPDLAVVLVTAYPEMSGLQGRGRLSEFPVVKKPFTVDELVERVNFELSGERHRTG